MVGGTAVPGPTVGGTAVGGTAVPGPTVGGTAVGGTAVGGVTGGLVGGCTTISTNTRPVRSVVLPSMAIAWFEIRSPGVAFVLTRTRIVTVAGASARTLTLHVTLLPPTLQLPLLALGVPTIVSMGLTSSSTLTVRAVGLLLKTEIEKLNSSPTEALEVETTFSAVRLGSTPGVTGVLVGGVTVVPGVTGVLVAV